MRQRLSAADLPALRALTTRGAGPPMDPALALVDGWACLGHVLDFYGERTVNEHYLRTCLHRRSAVELGRLVGYAPRPGLAADAFLAFTLDDVDPEAPLEVPAGTRAYTQPGPGETMQPFETSEAFAGRPRWSSMRPRLTAPQLVGTGTRRLYLAGTATGLTKGDHLLVVLPRGQETNRGVLTVATVQPDPERDRTVVDLEREPVAESPRIPVPVDSELLTALLRRPAAFTADRERLPLDPGAVFGRDSYAAYGLLESAYPRLARLLDVALGGTAHGDQTGAVRIHAMRVKAALHGHNAPLIPDVDPVTKAVRGYLEWNSAGTGPTVVTDGPGIGAVPAGGGSGGEGAQATTRSVTDLSGAVPGLDPAEIALDAVYDGILPGSYAVLVPPDLPGSADDGVHEVIGVRTTTRNAFNLPARVTVLQLEGFSRPVDDDETREDVLDRRVVVYGQSELLALAEVPVADDVCAGELELDGYYPGLHPGRRVIVTGERTDLLPADRDSRRQVTGVPGTELVMISSVRHRAPAGGGADGEGEEPAAATGDTVHTVLGFADPDLRYCYRRDTVQVLANVAHATHGESRAEVLGGGDATRPLQAFPLRQGPLTYLPSETTSGSTAALEVRVEDLRWSEAPHAAAVGPGERRYVIRTDDEGTTRVVLGLGARLPTGTDNVRALYRSGIGAVGNARAGQITVLASRPNGVMGVRNPMPATGGADRDDLGSIRQRVPIGLTALDRLVSAADLEDFARAFAGIGKARVVSAPAAPAEYTVVVAGVDDAPLTAGSALLTNLRRALARFGDLEDRPGDPVLHTRGSPPATVGIDVRTAMLLGIRARIRTLPDHPWEEVHPRLRDALVAAFGFRAREIGQVPYPGEAMAVMQAVRGVAWVDLLAFGTIPTGTPEEPRSPAEIADAARALFDVDPAALPGLPPDPVVGVVDLAYLAPDAAGTLLLEPASEEPRP
ncbi:baseplate J/gp47 family protein [Blastococcus colisei]|nr:baseplate J/gp47 family protein [Blastococcus colisei]